MTASARVALRAFAVLAALYMVAMLLLSGSVGARVLGWAGLNPGRIGHAAEVAGVEASPAVVPEAASSGTLLATLVPMERKLLDLLNTDREARGLRPLELDANLVSLARARSEDMATRNYFGHVTPEGTMVFNTMDLLQIPYKLAGENLARNAYPADRSPTVAHEGFLNSPKHAENDYDPDFNKIGIGVAVTDNRTIYFTELFAIIDSP